MGVPLILNLQLEGTFQVRHNLAPGKNIAGLSLVHHESQTVAMSMCGLSHSTSLMLDDPTDEGITSANIGDCVGTECFF